MLEKTFLTQLLWHMMCVMSRQVSQYVDPLDWIWIQAGRQLGFQIHRSEEVYASTDGKGTLRIGRAESLDTDDCLAQLILHELCHGLAEGEASFAKPDWGFRYESPPLSEDAVREHACLRIQAALLKPWGLDRLLAPTTEFRVYYDKLPENPIQPGEDPAITQAQAGLALARRPPFARILENALSKTALFHQLCMNDAPSVPSAFFFSSSIKASVVPSIWEANPVPKFHPTGFPQHDSAEYRCESCMWFRTDKNGAHCEQALAYQRVSQAAVEPNTTACSLYESVVPCQSCGACCQSAFEYVPVTKTDAILRRRPLVVAGTPPHWHMKRHPTVNQCGVLQVSSETSLPRYTCTAYELRPKTCRDVEVGSSACLTARKRMGYSL